MPLPAGTKFSVDVLALPDKLCWVVTLKGLLPSEPNTLGKIAYLQRELPQHIFSVPGAVIPHTQAEWLSNPVIASMKAELDQIYDEEQEEALTLLPNRKQLAKVIEQASQEFGESATAQQLADFILLKLSEDEQVVPEKFLYQSETHLYELLHTSKLQGQEYKGIAVPGTMHKSRPAIMAYLARAAFQNIKEIKYDS